MKLNLVMKWLGRVALAALGAVAIYWLVNEAGQEEVVNAVRAAAPWIALAFAIEALRIAGEAVGTVFLLAGEARRLPKPVLVRTHLIVYAVSMAMPAGRATSEAVKAVLLKPFVGTAKGAAVGTASQALTLIANALVSIPAALAALWVTGPGLLALALGIHAAVSVAGGALVLSVARAGPLAAWLGRFPRLGDSVRSFQDAAREMPLVPARAASAIIVARCLQVVQFGVIAHGVGLGSGPATALLAHGVQAVGAMVGDLVPAQLGMTEGAFRLAAEAFGSSAAVAVSVALIAHAVQLGWIVIGALVPLVWTTEGNVSSGSDVPKPAG